MPVTARQIEQPLGQDMVRRPPRPAASISARTAGTVLGALVLTAASALVALREQPFRHVEAPVAAQPVEAVAAAPEPKAAQPAPAAATGPSIVKVNPADAGRGGGVIVVGDPAGLSQNLRVAHLPDKALIEQSEFGPLPIRAADGRRPFDVYARPWSGARGARVAIVIGGLGVSQTGTQSAIERLPAEVTLAFASGGNSLGRWMQEARRKGHEIVMQLPLEPFDYPNIDPGKNTLTVDASPEENRERLLRTLGRTTNYTGVMNYMGARFTAEPEAMSTLLAELGRRGLAYLDDGSSARSVAPELGAGNGVPVAVGDATIDAQRERGAILKKLDQLEATARAKGFAIGTGSAFEATVEAVSSWINEAKRRGIEIVPVSAVAADPGRG